MRRVNAPKATLPDRATPPDHEAIIQKCLGVFIRAGALDVSLDRLAAEVGVSKRMLIHYFGGRDSIEERALDLLENGLRAQFAPRNFPSGISLQQVLSELWRRTTDPAAKGVLLLIMDVSRRAWNGSIRANEFYLEQQRLWVELLLHYHPERDVLKDVLQAFQGAVLAFLITGDAEQGRRMLRRFGKRFESEKRTRLARKRG